VGTVMDITVMNIPLRFFAVRVSLKARIPLWIHYGVAVIGVW
jgi:hypothetical protein